MSREPLGKRLNKLSNRVRSESMCVNAEFAAIERDPGDVGQAFSLPPGFRPARRLKRQRQPGRAAPQ
jgi:hypothetical protein